MTLLYYYFRTLLGCLIYRKSFRRTAFHDGKMMYKNYKGDDKKGIFQVLRELDVLCRYWKCFPDSYFRFAHFKKEYDDIELIKTYVPQGAYARYCVNSDPKYQILIDDKILYHDVMTHYGLPVPERFFSFSYGMFKANGREISDEEVDRILSEITDPQFFIKRNMCGEGSGVFLVKRKEDGFYTSKGVKITAKTIRANCSHSQYLFERQVIQHPVMAQFNPSSVNTCRIITFHNKAIACGARFGRSGSFIDNAAKGGLVVSVDMETGLLGAYGLREYDATKYYEHPDSHVAFKGVAVPHWKEMVAAVEKTCRMLPYYSSVGFDVACTPNGPVIIEINTGTGASAPQMGKDRGIADLFLKG